MLKRGGVLAAVAVLVAAPLATMAFTGTAGAFPVASGSVVCGSLNGNALDQSGSLSGCPRVTGGTGTISSFSAQGGDITWANGTTTDYTSSFKNPESMPNCPVGDLFEFVIRGTVQSSTNPGVAVGSVVRMTLCQYSSVGLTSASGTEIKI
jgi:hypothetical protein